MPAALAIPLIIGGVSAAGSVAGAVISSKSASGAAQTQANAAAQIRQQALDAAKTASDTVNAATQTADTGLQGGSDQGNAVIQQTVQQQMAALKPYIDAGQLSLGDLQQIFGSTGPLSGPGSQFSFTPQDYAKDPSFAFIQQQAQKALESSAAARGAALGGGMVRASDRLNTGLASTYLDQAFNRALATYNTNRQNLLTRIQGLTNINNQGFQATGATNQDIGVAGQLTNANIQNTSRQVAANQIAAGQYTGNTGLTAADIAAKAESGAANAQSAAQLAQGTAVNNGINGAINAISTPLLYGMMGAGSGGVQASANPIGGNPGDYSGGGAVAPAPPPPVGPYV